MPDLLPWTATALALGLLIAGLAGWAVWRRRRSPGQRPLPTQWTLSPRPVFSVEERRVYRQLREAVPHHIVLSKLPLVRFCQPNDPSEVRYWYELLGSVHVTFAICSANGRVLAAVDLETDRAASRRTLQVKHAVLAACKVRYLRCSADRLPSIPELQLLVPQVSGATRGPQAAPGWTLRDTGPGALSARRRERTTLWQDSGYLHDSFFGPDGRSGDAAASGFHPRAPEAQARGAPGLAGLAVDDPRAVGGVVTDGVGSRLRH